MLAEILATGEEIRTGALVDSNSAHIARALEASGVEVARIGAVGDDLARLKSVLVEIGARADVAVVTGGLGPTVDDLSAQAAAEAAGLDLVRNDAALAAIEEFYRRRNRPLNPSVRKQALLPRGAEMLANAVGTAPGFSLRVGRCRFFFLPGVPSEMKPMLAAHVLPGIERMRGPLREHRPVRTFACFGSTESLTAERVAGLAGRFPGVRLGLRAKFPEVQVKLYTSDPSEAAAFARLDAASAWVRERLGDLVFSETGDPMEAVVGALLRARQATLAVAESCTGGLLASRLTDAAGSSDYFLISTVAYANAAKVKVLGVEPRMLERLGAVHEETARQMAAGARRLAGSTYGLSTTGIAGPGGGSPEKPVGTVCIGLAAPQGLFGYRFHFTYGRRAMNKQAFAMKALDLLRRELLDLPHADDV
jgi:nicotinamide-nucleotide amidase